MKHFKIAIAIITIMLFITACIKTPTGAVITEDQIRIGYSGPLTGISAVSGVPNLRGVELAVDDLNKQGGINGKNVALFVQDDVVEEKKVINNFDRFVEFHDINAFLSITYGGLLALQEKAAIEKIPVINSLDTTEELAKAGNYVFAVGLYDESYGYTLAEFASKDLKKDRVAVLYNNVDPLLELIKDAFIERYDGNAIVHSYSPDITDFRSVLVKIIKDKVDTIVVIGFEESGLILKQAKQLGLNIQFLGWDIFSSQEFNKNAGTAAEGSYLTYWDAPNKQKLAELEEKYRQKYGEEPQNMLYTAAGYDTVMVLAEAMKTGEKGEALMKALHNVKDLEGVTGTLTMSKDGIVRSIQESMFTIENGQLVKVD